MPMRAGPDGLTAEQMNEIGYEYFKLLLHMKGIPLNEVGIDELAETVKALVGVEEKMAKSFATQVVLELADRNGGYLSPRLH